MPDDRLIGQLIHHVFCRPTSPAAPPTRLAAARWPGITPHSVQVLKNILKDSHTRWHIFLNDRFFHNHRVLAQWALGADPAVIEAGYKADSARQRPNYASPAAITSEDFGQTRVTGVKGFTGTSTAKPKTATHSLTIVARILKDARFTDAKYINPEDFLADTRDKFGGLIREYVEQWDADTSDPKRWRGPPLTSKSLVHSEGMI
ncbi:hypothetical protein M378DRAFT_163359 [Amanita muscaria Koide BX008]|uniref:Uncharacterized protein n=1 Tax=Amanita muscaria (strain Koide BX008) TaxID=946122 RepID=A0A0C2X4Y6_AMAMK|nr:hypothetical protein M378DRAFT_163359 [Amanita muscaria Koide BX008]